MTLAFIFWLFMLLWLVFGIYVNRANPPLQWGNSGFIFVLFGLVGWKVFGQAITG